MTNKMGTLKDFTRQGLRSIMPVINNLPSVIKLGTSKNIPNTIVNKSNNIRVNKEPVTLASNILAVIIHTLREKLLIMGMPDCPMCWKVNENKT